VEIWSRRAQELWGLRSEEVQGQAFFDLDIGLPVDQLRQPVLACLDSGPRGTELMLDGINRCGRPVRCQVGCTRLGDGIGRAGVILLMEEVPEEAGAHWGADFEAWLRGLKLEDRSLNRVLEELRGIYFDLDVRVDAFTKELRQMARSQDYAPMAELLSTVPGIGWLTALTLVVEIVDFSRFPDGEAPRRRLPRGQS